MRVFAVAVVAAVTFAIGAAVGLDFIQKTSSQAFHTEGARLDQQESVTSYGRNG